MQKHILIVEDESSIRDMVAFALRKAGMEAMHAADARTAHNAIGERVTELDASFLPCRAAPPDAELKHWLGRGGTRRRRANRDCGQAAPRRFAAAPRMRLQAGGCSGSASSPEP